MAQKRRLHGKRVGALRRLPSLASVLLLELQKMLLLLLMHLLGGSEALLLIESLLRVQVQSLLVHALLNHCTLLVLSLPFLKVMRRISRRHLAGPNPDVTTTAPRQETIGLRRDTKLLLPITLRRALSLLLLFLHLLLLLLPLLLLLLLLVLQKPLLLQALLSLSFLCKMRLHNL